MRHREGRVEIGMEIRCETRCLGCFLAAVINHSNKDNLRESGLVLAQGFRGKAGQQ